MKYLILGLLFSFSANAGMDLECYMSCVDSENPFGCDVRCKTDSERKIKNYDRGCFVGCMAEGKFSDYCRRLCRED